MPQRTCSPIAMPIMLIGSTLSIEDNLWTQDRKAKITTVRQIEQLVRISREFGREVATAKEARGICRIGEFYNDVDETLAKIGFAPNRKPGTRGATLRAAA